MSQLSMFGAKARPLDGYSNRGLSLERALERQHEEYRAAGKGIVVRQYDPSIVVKFPLARITGRAVVDYMGMLADGRPVAFDAKDCRDKRLALTRVQPHQAAFLAEVHRQGGLAGLVVRFEQRRTYWVPYTAWAAQSGLGDPPVGFKATGRKSISENDCPLGWMCAGVDWLSPLAAQETI